MSRCSLSDQRGSMIVFIAVAFPVVLGFAALVIDVGNLYLNRTQLANAADAAVFAGVGQLPKDPFAARSIATDYARRNGDATDTATVTTSPDNKTLRVVLGRTVPLFFAPILGMNSSDISATAAAQVSVAASVPWIVPFVLPKTQYFEYDRQFTMRMYDAKKPYTQYEFDYMNVGIENTNFQTYINYLKYGYEKTFRIGDNMKYLGPSSGGKESVEAFYGRTTRDPNSDYLQAELGDSRLMLIPLVDHMLPRTTAVGTPMQVVGFVGFFLEEVHKGILVNGVYGTSFYAKGKFLKDLNVGTGDFTSNPLYDFGVRTTRLIE